MLKLCINRITYPDQNQASLAEPINLIFKKYSEIYTLL